MNDVQIRMANEADAAAWDAYVMAHPRGTFFHRYGWKRLIESTYRHPGHYLVALRDGKIVYDGEPAGCPEELMHS